MEEITVRCTGGLMSYFFSEYNELSQRYWMLYFHKNQNHISVYFISKLALGTIRALVRETPMLPISAQALLDL